MVATVNGGSVLGPHAIEQCKTTSSGFAGRLYYPATVSVLSDHMDLKASGWRTRTGVQLNKPLTLSLTFTKQLAQ